MASPTRRRARWTAALAAAATLAVGGTAAAQTPETGDLPISPEWLANTLGRASTTTSVKNNVTDGAIARRDAALSAWKTAQAAYKAGSAPQPNPLAKPEYNVVWASKQNGADVNADVISKFVQASTVNPQGLSDLLEPQFLPGLDGFQVIDERKIDLNGAANPDYGKVVNFVQLPLPWGVENEAHHMQYAWHDGDPIVAGGLYTGSTFVLDPTDIPNLKLQNIIDPTAHAGGSIADAYEYIGQDRFALTLMGGPLSDFGGSPGEIVVFKKDKDKGLVQVSETPAGQVGGAMGAGNANGVPEPCDVREARPLGTCANPHGIEVRPDLGVGITSDYAEPREIVLDPAKTVDKYAFRPTIRSWDFSNPDKPVLTGVGHVPNGPLEPAQRAHEQYGIMENAKTYADAAKKYNGIDSKGFFAGSMCGGGVFFVPDATKVKGDFSKDIVQVWNDGLSQSLGGGSGALGEEPSGCAGGAWHQVTPNNKLLFRAVQGRNAGGDNYFDSGLQKMVYDINIEPLIKSAQDGKVDCDLSRGIPSLGLTGIELYNKLAEGEHVADCPIFVNALDVRDPTSGGPHWAAFDNHSVDQNGVPWRLTFSNYFVSRTGVDGDHRFYTVDVAPDGTMSYDQKFRDEKTGSVGLNFNRRDWPGSPDAGFYKPHSEIWVCPPGICADDEPPAVRATAAAVDGSSKARAAVCAGKRRFAVRADNLGKGKRIKAVKATMFGKKVTFKKNKAGRFVSSIDLRKAKKGVATLKLVYTLANGKKVTKTRTYHPCTTATKTAKKAKVKA